MPKPKVLIVEDEHVTATEFKEALLKEGFDTPVIADRISTAMVEFDFHRFDLVLLDITLKYDNQVNGIYLAEHIRKTSEVPIIFITGDTKESTLTSIKKFKNVDYMMKAVRPKELIFKSRLMIEKGIPNQIQISEYNDIVLLPINKAHKKIKKADILAIEAAGSYSNIFIVTEPQKHLLTINMKNLVDGLGYTHFFKLNRSTYINVNFIEKIEKDQLVLSHFNLRYSLQKGQKSEILGILPNIKTK